MKKTLFFLPLLVLALFSCEKIARLLTFDIDHSETIRIPASGLINTPVISPVPVNMRTQESFQNNNTSAHLVKDVALSKLTLTITDPAAQNFDFLKSIRIYIGAEGSDRVLLASHDNIPTGVSVLNLVPSGEKLDAYIKAESYTLYTEVALRSNVAQEISVKADSRFTVTADPL